MIPNFRAQGLISSDRDLGAAMSQSPRRGLSRRFYPEAVNERR